MYYPVTRPLRYEASTPSRLLRLMEDMLEPNWSARRGDGGSSPGALPTNVHETEEKYIVEVQMGGAEKEDIDLSLDEDVLTIAYESRTTPEEYVETGTLQSEWTLESQTRSISLPQVDQESEPVATLRNGVLRIELEKNPRMRRRKLSIE